MNGGTPSQLNADSVAAANVDALLTLGDHQYTYGTCSALLGGYDKWWGKLMSKSWPTAGPTHDWDATNSKGQQYQAYWSGKCPGQTSGKSAAAAMLGVDLKPQDNYSFDKGNWHIVSLSSGCYRYTVCDRTALINWLNQDLTNAQAAGKHILATFHEPYWSSSTSSHPSTEGDATKPLIDALYAHGARLVLHGHQHGYEHFYPQTNTSARDDVKGIESFTVGTGGVGFYSWSNTVANVKVHQSSAYGWLKLVLHADGSYDYQFVRTSGGSFTDSGSRAAN